MKQIKNNFTPSRDRTQKRGEGRTLVIGDIHGSLKALDQVLDRAYVTERDTVISLGDIVDGWPESFECVERLIELGKSGKWVFVRGNHDIWTQEWLNGRHCGIWSLWLQNGGRTTLESYDLNSMDSEKLQGHRDFFNNQTNWYIDEQNRLFVHAGWPYKLKDLDFFTSATIPVMAGPGAMECHWDRSLIIGAVSAFGANNNPKGKFKATEQFKEVYIGHTAMKDNLPHQFGNLFNLDSGCGWSGRLTIMDVDTKEYWLSDYSKDLYPDSKGRR